MKALDRLRSGSAWTDETTRVALPIVWQQVLLGKPITYGDLDKEVKKEGFKGAIPITYRYVAGKIGDVCEILAKELNYDFPPLNLIIVNQQTFLPSEGVDGYLSRFLKMKSGEIENLSVEDRDAYALEAKERALSFNGWEPIGNALQLGKVFIPPATTVISPPQLPDIRNFQGGAESEAHKRLKDWVANHPKAFCGFGAFKKGKLEQGLASGDRLDVFFEG